MFSLRKIVSTAFLLVFCIQMVLAPQRNVQAQPAGPGDGDQRQTVRQKPQLSSPIMNTASDTRFVADTGGDLDLYLFRDDRTGGLLKFNIPIQRYFFNSNDSKIQFTWDGFLTADAVRHVIEKKILPATLKLQMQVYDVDEDAAWCPERDEIYINGRPLYENGRRAVLTGANDTWSPTTYTVPIELLKFPRQKGSNLSKPPAANNEISIRIDASNCDAGGTAAWAVEVDYGVLRLETNPVRPIVFVHGWTGTTGTFNTIEKGEAYLTLEGIPSYPQFDLLEGIYPIANTAGWLSGYIYQARIENGVDKVNVFAHSKGGLFTRYALNTPKVAESVENLITFDTPHHGTFWADDNGAMTVICSGKYPLDPAKADLCYQATKELTIDYVRENFNYSGCTYSLFGGWKNCSPKYKRISGIGYYAFASQEGWNPLNVVSPDQSAGFPWNDNKVPMPSSLSLPDVGFSTDHGGILELRQAYECAIHRIDNSRFNCPGGSSSWQVNAAAIDVTASQPIYSLKGSTGPAGQFNTVMNVTESSQLLINAYSQSALNFTLTEPGGRVITSDVAASDPAMAYSTDTKLGVNHYVYVINLPITGGWTVNVQGAANVEFSVQGKVDSPVVLQLSPDQQTYHPGETITMRAALLQAGSPLKGGTVTGELEQPDGSFAPVMFYDDQTHGDLVANDGTFTGKVAAPNTQSYLYFHANASQASHKRESTMLIPVSPQTASIESASGMWGADEDGDGFFDYLDVDVWVNVMQSGHFDLQGKLVDAAGTVVATAQAQTREASALPLAAGTIPLLLRFNGRDIYQSGLNGPYTLTGLTLQDSTGMVFEVASANSLVQSSSYTYTQFQHDLLSYQGVSVSTPDLNSNGRFDAIVFNMQFTADVTGVYEATGRLLAADGSEVGWSSASVTVSAAGMQTLNLEFSGAEIGGKQANGPFTLVDANLTHTYGVPSIFIGSPISTAPYHFSQFENGFYKTYLPSVVKPGEKPAANTPTLAAPANNANLTTLIPTFSWTMGSQAEGTIGCLAISKTPDPTNCSMSFGASMSEWTTTMWYNLTPSTVYYWRVGVMPSYTAGVETWSEQWAFTTGPSGGALLPGPTLIAPANYSTIPLSGVTLSWSAVANAAGYDVSFHDVTNGYWYGFTTSDTQLTLQSYFLEAGAQYEWSVSARDHYAWGNPSVTWHFNTPAAAQSFRSAPEHGPYRLDEAANKVYYEP